MGCLGGVASSGVGDCSDFSDGGELGFGSDRLCLRTARICCWRSLWGCPFGLTEGELVSFSLVVFLLPLADALLATKRSAAARMRSACDSVIVLL